MSREELLVLRKTLKDLLDRGFIRASSPAAAAPVLFRDRYPLPLIAETLQNLAKAKWFTKLDVVAAFHKIRMAPGHEGKTAFRTRFGLYEWLVCPFGLSGAPASFQRYMNSVLREWLDDFVTAYLDDVLIYSSGSKADHEAKVRRVLQALADAGLHLDPAKCEFSVQEVKYLGFLGFANYYRIFIPDYAKITQSLDALLKKGTAFHWGRAENEAFQELKRRFCESPVLKQWDPSLPTFLETDCSGYALGGVLSQEGPDGRRHACAFFSKRLSPAEYNYPIHDKEMLAIMRCLDNWKNLGAAAHLQSLPTTATWTELSQFDFKFEYRPGSEAVVPDALSRREQDKPQGIDDEREQGRMIQLIPDKTFTLPEMKVFEEADLQQLWDETAEKDSIFRAAYKAVRDRERVFPPWLGLKIQISECAIDAGQRLTFRNRIWSHDSVAAGHPGREDRPRSHLSMDFITDLPPTGPSKARYLWVIVDRLTKAVTLECHYRFHGMPRSIVSDRGSNWLSRFWKRFCQLSGISQRLSTAYHPQTDGGPERMNQEIEAYLRAYVSYVQDDWGELLPAAQLALNNRESAATKISPFFAEHGYHVDPISVEESEEPPRDREESRADGLLSRLQEVNEYMQAVMAASQQQQEEAANAKRQPAERFEVGDKVWLSMANYRSPRPCKKLDWLHHKYTVTKVISSHVVELDVRGSIYPRFHVDLCGGRIKIRLLAKGR
ncbi:reverse transcriptase (RNA-dependent DNA polymerase) domain-containing protein [Hirsutella rhossiliensis]|uniref:Reverse transcriptase (RNA-dependent DNA polymerase) domain-containing protein n=1 Tax=Hirsutella rhossiliensis TaxID=111463 RepID=A0A9P8MPN3_9HYPO|nr:reverse transcriptase (RNA-dependent DNA polymerase) domain-containing protein [Hirsutella rhossiliensis]KAH0958990.1 reverse transcriptase (RNA-dependent DNA polymerase) domain-containing protein [Hirsutella rhossiliensis]